jgi:Raf kinase inhibitor-like YbhB/YbcL family protein
MTPVRAMAVAAFAVCAACASNDALPSFTVASLAFGDGETIPERHTCAGADLSPPLRFEGAPEGTASFAVVMLQADDGASPVARWLVWGIPAAAAAIGEGVPTGESPLPGIAQGTNGLDAIGYSGPCPAEVADGEDPDTAIHRYLFRAYALSAAPAVEPGASVPELLAAIDGLVIAKGSIEGFWGAE